MDADYWIKKWQDGETRFHQTKYHPSLVKFAGQFPVGTVLVPLCGKSLDMIFLSSLGHSVIGAELSPIACREFFQENGISFSEKNIPDFILFESEKVTLWCGDFFKLPQQVWDQVTGIYDRAALVALPKEVRQQYAAEISTRTTKPVNILLIAFEYPEGAAKGPPFSVPEQEIINIYDKFDVQLLHSEKEQKYTKDHPTLKSIELVETVYWLHINGRT
jgi:thiopurine S-methyltransferase